MAFRIDERLRALNRFGLGARLGERSDLTASQADRVFPGSNGIRGLHEMMK